MKYFSQVERAFNELKMEGQIFPTKVGPEIDQQKAAITRRAAYYIYTENDQTYGLLEKKSGLNVWGLSTDIILQNDGMNYDISTEDTDSDGTMNVRIINSEGNLDASLIPRWVKPTVEYAFGKVPADDGSSSSGGGKPVIPYDEAKSVDFGEGINTANEEYFALHGVRNNDGGMTSVMSMRAAWDYYVGDLSWEDSKKKHLNEYRSVYGLKLLV